MCLQDVNFQGGNEERYGWKMYRNVRTVNDTQSHTFTSPFINNGTWIVLSGKIMKLDCDAPDLFIETPGNKYYPMGIHVYDMNAKHLRKLVLYGKEQTDEKELYLLLEEIPGERYTYDDTQKSGAAWVVIGFFVVQRDKITFPNTLRFDKLFFNDGHVYDAFSVSKEIDKRCLGKEFVASTLIGKLHKKDMKIKNTKALRALFKKEDKHE